MQNEEERSDYQIRSANNQNLIYQDLIQYDYMTILEQKTIEEKLSEERMRRQIIVNSRKEKNHFNQKNRATAT